jgi:serine/threonine-protein kinase
MPRAIDPSRDLLFGVLALQTGLINQAQLVAAFHAWTQARDRPMAQILAEQGALETPCLNLVEGLVVEHLRRHGSNPERSLEAIGVGRSTRECLARISNGELDASLAHVSSVEPEPDADPDRTASYSVGTATSDGQRFRVLRPHARGGLGAVFVAVDTELHREVALKQILEEHADDPFSRERFIAEAEITGGLEHPGIVPVYGLGADAHGRPYYAMRFIKGDSLKVVIERFHADQTLRQDPGRRSLELHKLLRRFTDVCNAIDYAHSRGVIHRDIKPANIIVGKFGETLLVDWGLAKSVGRADPSVGEQTIAPSSSGSSETLPGTALGTPAYMSPEQARGELNRLGPRSDVYSLGATLYCLLTGKPPFGGNDAGAVLHAVEEGQFARPSTLEPALDKALEAVCLKAMAIVPADRYPTPRALADDLDRWMADEPVTAWPEPLPRRARRWALRHRTAVAAAVMALVAGIVGLSAVAAVQTRARADIARALASETRANTALAAANKELSRSQAALQTRYNLAFAAIKALHTGVSEDFLLKEERFKEPRDRLLKSTADFYGELGALLGKETDAASRRALAQSNFELADLTEKVGRTEAALAAHQAVLAAREALAAETGAAAGVTADVGRSLTAVASLLFATGKAELALAAYRRAESLLAEPAGSDPEARAALTACRTGMARVLSPMGKPAEALALLKRARADQEALAAAPGASNDARRDLAAVVTQLGSLLWWDAKPEKAEQEFRTALAIQQKLVDENPAATQFRSMLASSHLGLGGVMSVTGKLAEAEGECRTAIAIYQKLADDNPAVTRFRSGLAGSHNTLGVLLTASGKPPEGEAEFRRALAIMQKLADDHPVVTGFRGSLAMIHRNLGLWLLQMGKQSEADAELRTALAIQQKLADDNPAVTQFRDSRAVSLTWLGDLARSVGRAAEAKGGYERAIALLEPQVQMSSTNKELRYWLAASIRRRGLTVRDLGYPAGAAADARRALGLCIGLSPGSVWDLFETACCHAALAGLTGRAGSGVSAAEGEIEAARAVEWLRRAVALGYRNANEIRIESALDPLRARDDFRLLMMDIAFPAEPFAPVDLQPVTRPHSTNR